MNVLGEVIGRCLSREDGLIGAYLPRDLSIDEARSIVDGANAVRVADPAFAILVVADTDVELEGIGAVSVRNAVKWRSGNRLAVVCGAPGLIQSLTGVYRGVIGASYPKGSTDVAGLEEVAIEVMRTVLGWWRGSLSESQAAAASKRLYHAMLLLSEMHETIGSGIVVWNCQWFRHVNVALENLEATLRKLPPNADMGSSLLALIFPAFGLPCPADRELTLSAKASTLVKAADEFWGSETQIARSIAALGPEHPVAQVAWDGFDSRAAGLDSSLAALTLAGQAGIARTIAFQHLTESEFLNPFGQATPPILRVTDDRGRSLAMGDYSDAPFVVPVAPADRGRAELISIPVRVEIPTVVAPTPEQVAVTRLGLQVSAKTGLFDFELDVDCERLVATGTFVVQTEGAADGEAQTSFTITTRLDKSDSLGEIVPEGARAHIYLAELARCSCLVIPVAREGRLGAGSYFTRGMEPGLDDGSTATSIELAKSSRHVIFAWGVDEGSHPTIDGREMTRLLDEYELWSAFYEPPAESLVVVGDAEFSITVEQTSDSHPSPLLTALYDSTLIRERLGENVTESARGPLEDQLVRLVTGDAWLSNLGHHVVTEDFGSDKHVADNSGAVMVPWEIREEWERRTTLSVPAELRDSAEANAFREAFQSLGVSDSILSATGIDGTTNSWISQTSWRHLVDNGEGLLDDYLDTYAQLLYRAGELENAAGVFWAAYPFSFSVWGLDPCRAQAVLLSPLHPLRLAWLARFESALADVERHLGETVAGTVEGWNIPLLGPREITGGQMMAIPAETGADHVFAGWSLLVRMTAEFEQPSPPIRIGGRRAPGVSMSGLNRSSVSDAVRDFRRIHPHLSTIAIDIAAAGQRARSADIDAAVLGASRELLDDGLSSLPGGVRVFDSSHRSGDIPEDELLELASRGGGAPIVWKRYRPGAGAAPTSNIRLLEDSGVNIKVGQSGTGTEVGGVLAASGLRRFCVEQSAVGNHTLITHPTIRHNGGWPPMARALHALECGSTVPTIETMVRGAVIQDASADWTVSGEGGLGPVALADLLAGENSTNPQVIWEWRPPFLDAVEDKSLFERRPYVSIAKLPHGFREGVRDRLALAQGHAASDEDVATIFSTLGARGIGLSSLLAIGGPHTTGAIGFYLAIQLLTRSAPDDCERLVLPIDACDQFLQALSCSKGGNESQQRADLLIIDLYDRAVSLAVVEVKFFRLESSELAVLPEPTAPALVGPLNQLGASHRVLEGLRDFQQGLPLRSVGTQALWWNAFASLVDAGLRLSPSWSLPPDEVSERFRSVLDGEVKINIARPTVVYFQQSSKRAGSTEQFIAANVDTESDILPAGYRALISDPAAVFPELNNPGELIRSWRALFGDGDGGSIVEPDPSIEDSGREGDILVDETGVEEMPPASEAPDGDGAAGKQAQGLVYPVSDGVRFEVGTLVGSVGNASVDYWPANTALNQINFGVVGDLGTGKTQFIKALICNLRTSTSKVQGAAVPLLILDYKRDFQDETFLSAVGGRVLSPHEIPLNFFSIEKGYSNRAAYQRARAFVDVVTRIYGGVGPVQSNRLIDVIKDLYASKGQLGPTLREIRDSYKAVSGTADSIVSILDTFVENEVFAENREDLVPFADLIGTSTLVVALNELGTDQATKNALVILFLNCYYEYMLRQPKKPYIGSDPQLRHIASLLVVDEATNIMKYGFDVLRTILLEGREFGFGVVLSSQFLDHFKVGQENYGQALGSWLVHKVPNVTARQLQTLGISGATDDDAKRITSLPVHEAYYKSLSFDGRFVRGRPFFELIE